MIDIAIHIYITSLLVQLGSGSSCSGLLQAGCHTEFYESRTSPIPGSKPFITWVWSKIRRPKCLDMVHQFASDNPTNICSLWYPENLLADHHFSTGYILANKSGLSLYHVIPSYTPFSGPPLANCGVVIALKNLADVWLRSSTTGSCAKYLGP